MEKDFKFPTPNEESLGNIRAGMEFLQAFRLVEPSMPLSYALAFLQVAMDPGHGTVHYGRSLGMLQPVISRILLEIGQKARTGGMGLDLVESKLDVADLRLKRYSLTQRGNALLANVEAALARRRRGDFTPPRELTRQQNERGPQRAAKKRL